MMAFRQIVQLRQSYILCKLKQAAHGRKDGRSPDDLVDPFPPIAGQCASEVSHPVVSSKAYRG
jgi:hypothetical protein